MKKNEKKIKKQTTTQIEIKNDQVAEEMLDDLRQVVEFHKLYLTQELEEEKAIHDALTTRISELRTELENAEIVTDKANEGFYF